MNSVSIRRAVYAKLTNSSSLTQLLGSPPAGYTYSIYHSQAPEFATYPLVIINKQTGDPTDAFTRPSVFDTDVWMIKAVDHNTTADTAENIRDRIVALLNDAHATLSISGGTACYLRRTSDVEYPEVVDGELYRHVGSSFRLVTTSTS